MKINIEQLEAELHSLITAGQPVTIQLQPQQAFLLAYVLRETLRHFDMMDGTRDFIAALVDGIENQFPKEATNIHRVIAKGGLNDPSS